MVKYDKDHIDKILASLANGDGRVRACKEANIHYSTFLDWFENKAEFSEQIKKAEQTGYDKIKDICQRRIIEDKSWTSAAWWLERRYKEEFGRDNTEQSKTGQIITVENGIIKLVTK